MSQLTQVKIEVCRICGNEVGNNVHRVRDIMFKHGDQFEYIECGECGCLQIEQIPADLWRYYPKEYYSFTPEMRISTFLKRQRARYYLGHKNNLIGMISGKIFGRPDYVDWLQRISVDLSFEILDVGCGIGQRVSHMRDVGFLRIVGVDPYIDNDIDYGKNCRIHKCQMEEIEGVFDLVMFNHSLEHLKDPLGALKTARRILKEDGIILVRTPVASFAWLKYGVFWIQLDPPRHLHVHTVKSMKILAGQSGLKVTKVDFDSTSFQFWGSEQYVRDIPHRSAISYEMNKKASIFKKSQIKAYEEEAKVLNMKGQGDQACFYLLKS